MAIAHLVGALIFENHNFSHIYGVTVCTSFHLVIPMITDVLSIAKHKGTESISDCSPHDVSHTESLKKRRQENGQ